MKERRSETTRSKLRVVIVAEHNAVPEAALAVPFLQDCFLKAVLQPSFEVFRGDFDPSKAWSGELVHRGLCKALPSGLRGLRGLQRPHAEPPKNQVS